MVLMRPLLSADGCDASPSGSNSELSLRSVNSTMPQIIEELELMKSLGQHENVVQFIGYSFATSGRPFLVMEYCSRGNLRDYLRNRAERRSDNASAEKMTISRSEALLLKSFAYQVARGMKYLSDKNVSFCVVNGLFASTIFELL